MKVTRIAYSRDLDAGKYGELVGQVRRLGRARSLVWDRYGSITGVGLSDRRIRDAWMADGTATSLGVLANAWKETVRDAVADILKEYTDQLLLSAGGDRTNSKWKGNGLDGEYSSAAGKNSAARLRCVRPTARGVHLSGEFQRACRGDDSGRARRLLRIEHPTGGVDRVS